MTAYEHVLIARQDISGTQAEGLMTHFSQILKDNGANIHDSEYWGLKTLAYKIKKNRKGHYLLIKSESPSDAVSEMERLARIHDDVLRVLSIRVDEHSRDKAASSKKGER